jgi:hypothetical protein
VSAEKLRISKEAIPSVLRPDTDPEKVRKTKQNIGAKTV